MQNGLAGTKYSLDGTTFGNTSVNTDNWCYQNNLPSGVQNITHCKACEGKGTYFCAISKSSRDRVQFKKTSRKFQLIGSNLKGALRDHKYQGLLPINLKLIVKL